MASTANLSVQLTAITGPFIRGMGRARRAMHGFRGGIASASKTLLRFGGIAAGVAGIGSLTVATKRAFEHIDAQAKLADKLGESTEALAGLSLHAKMAGVSEEDLTKHLQRMAQNVDKATRQTGKAVGALDDLGISADMLSKMSPAEQMETLADAFARVGGAARRANVAQDIFGKGGAKMVGVLAGGRAALRRSAEEAKRLGLAFSRIDAAKVELANSAITRMRRAIGGLFNQLAIKMAPIIGDLADRLTKWMTSGTSVADLIGKAFSALSKVIGFIADKLENLIFLVLQASSSLLRTQLSIQSLLPGATAQKAAQATLATIQKIEKIMAKMASGKSPGERMVAWLIDVKNKAQAAAERLVEMRKGAAPPQLPRPQFGALESKSEFAVGPRELLALNQSTTPQQRAIDFIASNVAEGIRLLRRLSAADSLPT